MSTFKGAGGTPGGIGEFITGLVLSTAGAHMIMSQVTVSSHFFLPYFAGRGNAFGPVFTVFLLGVFILFMNKDSRLGWGMTWLAILGIAFGVVNSLEIYFRPTSLLNTVIMFGLFVAGLGLILRSLQDHTPSSK